MKQQLANAKKYKDVIHEEKDLTHLVGTESDFDVDVALRTMMTYYECWKGNDPRLIDRISIVDEEITKTLADGNPSGQNKSAAFSEHCKFP